MRGKFWFPLQACGALGLVRGHEGPSSLRGSLVAMVKICSGPVLSTVEIGYARLDVG